MPTLRFLDGGRLLYGGSPPRFLRLTENGARSVRDVIASGDRSQAPRLSDRLVKAGMIPPSRPPASTPARNYSIVIPHYNDPDAAAATLMSLAAAPPPDGDGWPTVVVVDDGSEPRLRSQLKLQLDDLRRNGFDTTTIWHESNRGPAVARNTGFAQVSDDAVVFLDSGVLTNFVAVKSLVQWLAVSSAAGPRVMSPDRPGAVGRFERTNSALDMTAVSHTGGGSVPQLVGPARVVRYLPTAMLAVNAQTMRSLGGFDESMRTGEDVDLVWRIDAADEYVVFDPTVVVHHEPRGSIRQFADQRFGYGRSGGPLAARHGSTIAPAVARYPLLLAIAGLVGAPLKVAVGVGTAALAFDVADTARRFDSTAAGYPSAGALGVTESLRFNGAVFRWWVRASVRAWWPLLALALVQPFSKRLRRRAVATLTLRLADFAATVGPSQIPMALLDEIAYGAGLWTGAKESGSATPLLPRIL